MPASEQNEAPAILCVQFDVLFRVHGRRHDQARRENVPRTPFPCEMTMGEPKRRILIFSCMQEVSSFNPVPSTIDDFNIGHGQEWLDDRRSIDDEIGGALSVFEAEEGIEMVPTMGANAITSGGTLQAADWASLRDDLVASLEDNLPRLGGFSATTSRWLCLWTFMAS